MKVNKVSFPKGSLKFKKMPVKAQPKINYKELSRREEVNRILEKNFPHEQKLKLPGDLVESMANNANHIRYWRKEMAKLTSPGSTSSYEITFTHPKWSKFLDHNKKPFGSITIKSDKNNLNETLKLIASKFKEKKNEYRKLRFKTKTSKIKSYDNTAINYNISGGCIYMPEVTEGVFLKFMKDEDRKIVYGDKIPKDTEHKYVGIEIEFLCPANRDVLGSKLYDLGLGRHVTLKADHSIKCSHGNYPSDCQEHRMKEWAHELCIIAKESEYSAIVGKVCKLLEELKATVNKSCGMHVHLDCRTRDPEKVYQNLVSSQNILLRMNPKSRIETFARVTKERDFEMAKTRGGDREGRVDHDRYYAINAKAYNRHKTIEIRAHAGTVDFIKITNWINILTNIANCAEKYTRSFATINTFCKRFGISNEVQTYIEERINKFKIKVEGGNEVAPEAERGVA